MKIVDVHIIGKGIPQLSQQRCVDETGDEFTPATSKISSSKLLLHDP